MTKEQRLAGWRVVLVEDDPNSLNIMERLLGFHGATIYSALNGELGLAAARQEVPDFIVTDLSMPVMDGWTMIQRLREDPTTQNIPIVTLTAHAMIEDRERAMALGANHYLTKPLNARTFIDELIPLLQQFPSLAARLQ